MSALRFIRDEWMWCALASPGSIPKKLRRMRGKHDSDEQGVRIIVLELGRRGGVFLGEPMEELEDLVALHRESMTSRIE